ncbi:addiction module HigA family antidote [Erwinia persicina]|uniref:HigA family addiction module antitoxin n=2 Tax=Erwinia TaxID=551 RepID=A0ABV4E1R7_9GAMM|nr:MULTISPECIES: HigA family addiction module antitoxin [Erwinia]MCP1440635.1 addiction module HigA family antidote [Erwinia persicina]MDN4629497.1 HigA family addiction module antitoxin [Erwinia sp. PsM31]
MGRMFNPPHPGGLIRESMESLGLSARQLASALHVAPSTVQRLIVSKSDISPEMALRLAAVLGGSADVWLAMQRDHDLWRARQRIDLSVLHRLQPA